MEFWDVFSGVKADVLLPHQKYNLKIKLQEGAEPYHGLVYSLSQPELTTLSKFLDKNVKNGFIRPTRSPWGSLVLFVKKKDGGLRLCVDF